MEWRNGSSETLQRVREIYEFIVEYRAICEVHSVGYFTEDHWSNVVPLKWRRDLLETEDLQNPIQLCDGELKVFLERAKSLKLDTANIPHVTSSHDPNHIDNFGMSSKKAHEVKRMANCIKSVATPSGVKQIIDIGSGKGYLSQCLAFTHKFTVVGIDSESINTRGAIERCKKVEKYFKKNQSKRDTEPTALTSNARAESSFELFGDVSETLQSLFSDCDTEDDREATSDTSAETSNHKPKGLEPTNYREVEPSIKSQTRAMPLIPSRPLASSFFPLTHCITPCDNIFQLVTDKARGYLDPLQPTALVGLHTCGNLGPNLLRQFIATPNLTALCVVCCCYHHVTVGRVGDSTTGPADAVVGPSGTAALYSTTVLGDGTAVLIDDDVGASEDVPGFPMSSYLKSVNAYLGRNTRMLAGQSEGRFHDICFGKPLQSVFYRAILHVVLEKEMKLIKNLVDSRTLLVGPIKTFDGFVDYSRKAFDKLKIPQHQQPSDETLHAYHQQYIPKLSEMQRLVQLRAILAPVIESFFILDRLLYLQEHCEVKDAWIAQLFSPQISPRCFALCAVKS